MTTPNFTHHARLRMEQMGLCDEDIAETLEWPEVRTLAVRTRVTATGTGSRPAVSRTSSSSVGTGTPSSPIAPTPSAPRSSRSSCGPASSTSARTSTEPTGSSSTLGPVIVLAVDPGTMTGYATLDTTEEVPTSNQLPYDLFQERIFEAYNGRIDVQLVIERFVINAGSMKKSREGMHHAIQTIGLLEFLARHNGWPTPLYQLPADVMRLVDNKSLRHLGWYARGMEHANDALRHLAVWSLKQGRISRKDIHPSG